MKSEWKSCLFGDVLTLQRGFDITKKEQKPGFVPVISSSGINSYHTIAKVKGPGVIIGRKGSLGTVFYSKEDYWPHDTTLWVKDFHGNSPKFTYYFLNTLNIANLDVGAANPTLNRNHVHLLPVYWPSLPIQRTIASILSVYDELIENNTRRIAILEETARLLYQEWFVQFRFPGHEEVKMVESALGMIPEGWEVAPLGDVAGVNLLNLQSGGGPEEIFYVDIASVATGQINNIEHISFHQAPGRARRIVKHGDIIWSMVRPNRKSYSLVLHPPENLIVSTGFAVISARSIPYTYLYLCVTTDDFTDYLTNRATGAAYPAVNTRDFQAASLLLPPPTLLNTFHTHVESALLQKQILLNVNATLRRTRDKLLPKLVSGELDVSSWVEGEVSGAGARVARTMDGGQEMRRDSRAEEEEAYGEGMGRRGGQALKVAEEARPVERIEREGMEWQSLWE